jgi:cell wall-associated NlpC family hydrolase
MLAIAATGALLSINVAGIVHAQDYRPEAAVHIGAEVPLTAAAPSAVQSFADRALNSAQELVLQAMGMIGIRYSFGGRNPDTGFDCSGLVRYVFDRVMGRSLPHNSYEMARMGTSVRPGELEPGDLVFYNTRGRRYSHVGIYVGEGRFIHAPSRGGQVHIVNMADRYWVSRFNGARRLAG